MFKLRIRRQTIVECTLSGRTIPVEDRFEIVLLRVDAELQDCGGGQGNELREQRRTKRSGDFGVRKIAGFKDIRGNRVEYRGCMLCTPSASRRQRRTKEKGKGVSKEGGDWGRWGGRPIFALSPV